MSYIPSTEKLTALGYTLQPDWDGFGRQEYRWSRRRITTWKDAEHVAFMEHMGLDPNPKTVFSLTLPSEEFFDQLLVALDWH
jgi:hypothetical protein